MVTTRPPPRSDCVRAVASFNVSADPVPGPGQGGPTMRRIFASLGFIAVLISVGMVLGQPVPLPPTATDPPRTLPPLTGVIPASGTAPVPTSRETPLSKLE